MNLFHFLVEGLVHRDNIRDKRDESDSISGLVDCDRSEDSVDQGNDAKPRITRLRCLSEASSLLIVGSHQGVSSEGSPSSTKTLLRNVKKWPKMTVEMRRPPKGKGVGSPKNGVPVPADGKPQHHGARFMRTHRHQHQGQHYMKRWLLPLRAYRGEEVMLGFNE